MYGHRAFWRHFPTSYLFGLPGFCVCPGKKFTTTVASSWVTSVIYGAHISPCALALLDDHLRTHACYTKDHTSTENVSYSLFYKQLLLSQSVLSPLLTELKQKQICLTVEDEAVPLRKTWHLFTRSCLSTDPGCLLKCMSA